MGCYSIVILAQTLGPVESNPTRHSFLAMELSRRIPPTHCACACTTSAQTCAATLRHALADFLWTTTVQCGEAEGAFGRNLRTHQEGWLSDARETVNRVVTSHCDVVNAGEHFVVPSSGLEPVRSLGRERQPYELVGSSLAVDRQKVRDPGHWWQPPALP